MYARLLDIVERREAHRARRATAALLERLDRTTLSRVAAFVGAPDPGLIDDAPLEESNGEDTDEEASR